MDRRTGPRWDLVLILGAVGLVRPLLSIVGGDDVLGGGPRGPILVTAALAVLWVSVVVTTRAPNPVGTLAAAGALYGILAILLQQAIWKLSLGDAPEGASPGPVLAMSWVSILLTNAIWGAFLGLVASGLVRLLPRRGPDRGAEE